MSRRYVVSPVSHGARRILDEVGHYEGDHEWCPDYEWVDGVSDTLYPTQSAALAAMEAMP